MESLLRDWLGRVVPDPEESLISQRLQGIDAAISGLDPRGAANLALMVFEPSTAPHASQQRLREAIRRTDATFPETGRAAELAVLAAASVARLMESQPGQSADAAALAVNTCSFAGRREPECVPEVIDRSKAYLANRSLEVRDVEPDERVQLTTGEKGNLTKAISAVVEPLTTGDFATAAPQLESLLSIVADAVTKVSRQAEKSNLETIQLLEYTREEVDILWWVFNLRCNELAAPFAELPAREVCLIAGFELAELTAAIPAPYRATDFLDRVLTASPSSSTELSIQQVINSAPREWRESLVAKYPQHEFERTTPTLTAARKSTETESKSDWLGAYEMATGLGRKTKLQPADHAMQLFFEILLVRAIEAA